MTGSAWPVEGAVGTFYTTSDNPVHGRVVYVSTPLRAGRTKIKTSIGWLEVVDPTSSRAVCIAATDGRTLSIDLDSVAFIPDGEN